MNNELVSKVKKLKDGEIVLFSQEERNELYILTQNNHQLSNLQKESKEWTNHNFPNGESWMPLVGATEELGELCHIHLKDAQGIRKIPNVKELKMDAVGDIIIFLADYCNRNELDLEQSVFFAWNTASQRDWIKFPKNGLIE